ncbi:MAG: hypothetical protein ACLPKB_24775 [Xanthobacteraceae bacterium]
MPVLFSVPSLQFEVVRYADGSVSWSEYFGGKVKTAIPLDDGVHCVLLLDRATMELGADRNLICVARDGRIVWVAKLPQTHDAFLRVQMEGGKLYAHSWSSYRVTLDPATGETTELVFTK